MDCPVVGCCDADVAVVGHHDAEDDVVVGHHRDADVAVVGRRNAEDVVFHIEVLSSYFFDTINIKCYH